MESLRWLGFGALLGVAIVAAMAAWSVLERWLSRRRQHTFVYCPGCQRELVACLESPCWHDTKGLVRYQCAGCGNVSAWDFDMPVPVLVIRDAQAVEASP